MRQQQQEHHQRVIRNCLPLTHTHTVSGSGEREESGGEISCLLRHPEQDDADDADTHTDEGLRGWWVGKRERKEGETERERME